MNQSARWLRLALFFAGVALVAWLVRSAGPSRVLAAMVHAGPWLPIVVVLEAAMIASDLAASHTLVGSEASSVPSSTWLRATTLAYASSILLPAGRAAGEATRAASLAPAIGAARATGACTRLQAAVLLANAMVSVVIAALVLTVHEPELLGLALLGNAAVCGAAGTALLLLLRSAKLKGWLLARFPALASRVQARAPGAPSAGRAAIGRAIGVSVLARAAQGAQYGIVVRAVGGVASVRSALSAQGIHLVGAAVGDVVPGQVGATEGAYRLFATVLKMDASQALSVALVVRAAQLTLASLCLAVGLLASRQVRAPALR